MGKLSDSVKKFFTGREGDKKFHANGLEYPDPTAIEVPLKLMQRHQDAQAYIRAYVDSQIALAQQNAEHETIEDAFDYDVPDDPDHDHPTAAELEAEELAQMANDRYDLRRVRAMLDRDRKLKAMKKGAAAAAAAGAKPQPVVDQPAPAPQPIVEKTNPPS